MNSFFQLGRLMIIAGVALVAAGLLFITSSKTSFLGFGRLPGDVVYKGKNSSFYFPIVSCLVLSAVLSLVLWLISLFTRR